MSRITGIPTPPEFIAECEERTGKPFEEVNQLDFERMRDEDRAESARATDDLAVIEAELRRREETP